jgi:uncharacterized phiE125 gp8 family phage protein
MPRRDPITVLTPPASEPITRAELINQLRLNSTTGLEAELDRAIATARELFEGQTGRAVMPTAFRQHLTEFRTDIDLQIGPVTSLDQVKYYDGDDLLQTLAGCSIDTAEIPAVVYLPDDDWPALSDRRRRPAYIDFTAGWTNSAAVPATVKTAILLLASHYYEFRTAYVEGSAPSELPQGWERVIELYRTGLEYAS